MPSANVGRVRQFMEDHFRNPSIVFDFCTDDAVLYFAWGESTDGAKAIFDLLSPPSDPEVVIDDCFGDGDRVAMHMRLRFSVGDKDVWRDELLLFRLEGELIAEIWAYFDRQYESEQRVAASGG